jgi:hypothetical protein
MGIIYTAGPYRPGHGRTVADNIAVARKVAIELWRMGHFALCPHLNTANFEEDAELPDEYYLDGDLKALARCDAVVMLPTWTESEGAKGEHDYALARGIPIYYYPDLPGLHPVEVRYPEQTECFIANMFRGYRIYLKRNHDYSPANIKGTGTIGVVVRLWDKMARIMNLSGFELDINQSAFTEPKKAQSEPLEDAYLDLQNYAHIGQVSYQGKWGR